MSLARRLPNLGSAKSPDQRVPNRGKAVLSAMSKPRVRECPKKSPGIDHAMAMTGDVYGHLLPDLENDAAKMEAGALALVQ